MPIDIKTDAQTGPGAVYFSKKVHLTMAQILTLQSVPVEAIPSPGAGKAIDILSVSGRVNDGVGGLQYTPLNTVTYVAPDTGSPVAECTAFTSFSGSGIIKFIPSQSNVGELVDNASLVIFASTDLVDGDGNIDIYIAYRIVTL